MPRTDDQFETRRRVLRPATTVEAVDAFAQGVGWPMDGVTERDREAGTDGEVVWRADGHKHGGKALTVGALRYVEDAMFGIGHIVLTGRPKAILEPVFAAAVTELEPWTDEELRQAFDDAPDSRARGQAALRLGLAAPAKPDRATLDRIAAALRDGDARVRYASIWAASYAGYGQFADALQAIADKDDEAFLRERAALTLKALAA